MYQGVDQLHVADAYAGLLIFEAMTVIVIVLQDTQYWQVGVFQYGGLAKRHLRRTSTEQSNQFWVRIEPVFTAAAVSNLRSMPSRRRISLIDVK